MTTPLEILTAAQAHLDRARVAADAAQLARDRAILDARDHGVTWAAIQQATGMTPRAVAKAIERAQTAR